MDETEREYWHVIVVPTRQKIQQGFGETVAVDKDRAWIEKRILGPRRLGESITVRGKTFGWDDIQQLRITVSRHPATDWYPQIEQEWRQSAIVVPLDVEYRAADKADDVTDDLIDGPPGTSSEGGSAPSRVNAKVVMVVYGRDSDARHAMFDFLRALGLSPQEWARLVEKTGKASPYVGEVLERAFEEAAAVIVLLTPDDEARLQQRFLGDSDPPYERELTSQARPNVLFEAGMAFGIHPDRTVLVELGELRPFSDIGGRHVIRLNESVEPLREIAKRLKTAGCEVDESGDDWLAPGRFTIPESATALGRRLGAKGANSERGADDVDFRVALAEIAEELEAARDVLQGHDAPAFFVLRELAVVKWQEFGSWLARFPDLHKVVRGAYRSIDAMNNRGVTRGVTSRGGKPTTLLDGIRVREAESAIGPALDALSEAVR
ncbi:MAG TPA: nucleotide-binding protein [Solirubrobacterales bacterium]|nr:nucleotide-binding protein [Solirubrobacterales bacterium]